MDMNLLKRGISFILCLAMLIGNVPATVFAAESDGLCAHHTEHIDCGYEEGVSDCDNECADCAAETEPEVKETPAEPAATEKPFEPVTTEEPSVPTVTEEPSEPVEETTAPTEDVEETTPIIFVERQAVTVDIDLPDDHQLYTAYAEQVLYGNQYSFMGTAAGERLQGDEKVIYDALVPFVKKIASGQRASTVIAMGQTVQDMEGNIYTPETEAAFTKQMISDESMARVFEALLSDMPFELYWFDKVGGFRYSYLYAETILYLEVEFNVSWNYRGASALSVDTVKTGAATEAASSAQSIVSKYAASSDYKKLIGYRDEICTLVTYNDAAASGGDYTTDNDPWQLIYVFDGDASTNVVCEGYSKAFMYLCDLTDFAGSVSCYTVSGKMNDGNHMWNVVTLEGNNYLVDVTNSDSGSVGQNGGLFLVGGSGSAAAGYTFLGYHFTYDDGTKSLWGTGANSILTLAETDYSTGGSVPGIVKTGTCGSNLFWTFYSDGLLEITGSGSLSDCSSSYNASWNSFRNEITRITLPEGLTSVGSFAFAGNFDAIGAPVEIPMSCTLIKDDAFGTGKVLTLSYPGTMAQWLAMNVGEFTYDCCYGAVCSDGTILYSGVCGDNAEFVLTGDGVLTVSGTGLMGFYEHLQLESNWSRNTDIKTVVIEEGITSIAGYAFKYCTNLKTIYIPASLKWIDYNAFENSGLTDVYYASSEKAWASITISDSYNEPLFNATIHYSDPCTQGHDLGDWVVTLEPTCTTTGMQCKTCSRCDYYEEEPVEVKDHSYDADNKCTACGYIGGTCGETLKWTLLDGVLTISGSGAMKDYTYSRSAPWYAHRETITSVQIESGVTSIGDYAFAYCASLTSISIPASVTNIGSSAFSSCDNLTDVYIVDIAAWLNISFESLHSNPMQGDFRNNKLYLNGSLLTDLVIPDGVTTIGDYAFYCCGSLTSITIPASVTSIGRSAFGILTNLKNVYITDPSAWCKIQFADSNSNPAQETDCLHILDAQGNEVTEIVLDDSVTAIPVYAFYSCKNLISVRIPDTVTTIGSSAFSFCDRLTSVNIPDGVTTIGNYVFNSCDSLTSIRIPDYVTSIGNSAFSYCSGLTSINIPEGVTSIGDSAFSGCSGLTGIDIPEGVTSIGRSAFSLCDKLTNIVIPEGVTTIEDRTFSFCDNLTNISIPASVQSIGASVFSNCSSLTDVFYGGNAEKWTALGANAPAVQYIHYNCTDPEGHWTTTTVDSTCTTGSYACDKCPCGYERNVVATGPAAGHNYVNNICSVCQTVEIRTSGTHGANIKWSLDYAGKLTISGTGSMKEGQFNNSSPWWSYRASIETVEIQNGVTNIGGNAFYECTNLSSIVIPDSVTSIGDDAFYSCSLTSIKIPARLTSIGDAAFYSCSLTDVYITDPSAWCKISFGSNPLRGNYDQYAKLHILDARGNEVTDVVLNNSVTTIPDYAFINSNLTSIVISDSVQSIGSYAFWDCSSLESATIGSSVTSIPSYAFRGCSSLKSIVIPDSVTGIGAWAFSDCTSLLSATLGSGLISIGSSAFWGCSSLKSVVIPDSVQSIGSSAFTNCSNLITIVIPDGVSSIGFSGCRNLMAIYIPASVTSFDSSAFLNCGSLCHVLYGGTEEQWTALGGYSNELKNAKKHYGADPSALSVYEHTTCKYKTLFKCDICGDMLFDKTYTGSHQYEDGTCTVCGVPAGLSYTITYGKVTITGYTGSAQSVEIPATVEGYPVIEIGSHAFSGCTGLTSIVIPDSVTSIGKYAFQNCTGLTSVTIGKGVQTIEYTAFIGCNALTDVYITDASAWCKVDYPSSQRYAEYLHILDENGNEVTEVTLDSSVTKIPNRAFMGCTSLTSITIPDSVTSIGSSAFASCTALKDITIPDSVISIGDSAFSRCAALTDITIPDSVTSIGMFAFYYCTGLTSITIGKGLRTIGIDSFSGCTSLTDVYISDIENWWSVVKGLETYDKYDEYADPVYYADVLHILDDEGNEVTELTLDSAVTQIPHIGFYKCRNLTSVTIHGNVTSIGNSAFYECTGLTSVVLPDSVTSIGDYAFRYCSSLTSVTTGSGLTSIGEYAFYGCSSLESIVLPDSLTSISGYTFQNCTGLTSIVIPDGVTSMGHCVFDNCTALTSIVIPGSVTSMGDAVFQNCAALTSIVIPGSVTSIGSYVFEDCTGLTNVVISEGVTSIPYSAFENCTSLTSIVIPDSVTSIDNYAFYGCTALTSVTMGSGLQNVSSGVFSGCNNLTDVYITDASAWCKISFYDSYSSNPMYYADALHILDKQGNKVTEVTLDSSVTAIPASAFANCKGLERITIPGSVQNISRYAFQNCTDLASVNILDGVTGIDNSAFYNCSALTNVAIPDSVTSIGTYAFYNCCSLMDIAIPDSVQTLGQAAFAACDSLTSVILPDGITVIGDRTFEGCSSLTSGTIPESVQSISYSAFYDCVSLKQVNIPDGVTTIYDCAFFNCSALTDITISNSVTTIYNSAFSNCHSLKDVYYCGTPYEWSQITIANGNQPLTDATMHYVVSGSCGEKLNWILDEETGLLRIFGIGAITSRPWAVDAASIRTVVIEDGVTSICNDAFNGCSALTSVTISASVETIGDSAFNSCRSLTSITIPEGVKSIGRYAFGYCWNLKDIRIPYSVTEIQYAAFYRCDALQHVYYGGNAADWRTITIGEENGALSLASIHYSFRGNCGDEATWIFDEGTGTLTISGTGAIDDYDVQNQPWKTMAPYISSVVIKNGVTGIGNNAFRGCTALKNIEIPDSVTDIGAFEFYGCSSLTSMEIPNGVTAIENGTFANCTELTGIVLPRNLVSIGKEAFWGCSKLQSINIPTGVTMIPEYAFYNCAALTTVEIPESVTCIEYNAFRSCTALHSITIGTGLTKVVEYAFENCTKLKNVYYYGTEDQWKAISVGSGNKNFIGATVNYVMGGTCGQSVSWMYDENTGTLTIFGTGAMTDYDYFDGANYTQPWQAVSSTVETVVIKNGVTHIGQNAFARCRNVVSVEIPESVTTIGGSAFFQCYALESVTLPSNLQSIGESVFRECMALSNIRIPASVTQIGSDALATGYELYGIWVDAANPAYCNDANGTLFSKNMRTLIQVPGARHDTYNVPYGVNTIASSAFRYSNRITEINIPNTVTKIEAGAFLFCQAVKHIVLPNSLTRIERNTFDYCQSLTSIVIPASVTEIEPWAFGYLPSATDLYYGGTASQWSGLSENVPENLFVHFACTDITNHWRGVETPATCTAPGSIHERCNCGYERTKTSAEPAKGHVPVAALAVAPTCTETGLTEGSNCYVCGESVIAQEVVPATGHNLSEEDRNISCSNCDFEMYVRINQDYVVMDLQVLKETVLDTEWSESELGETLQWTVEETEDVIDILADNTIIAKGVGTAYAVATLTYNAPDSGEKYEVTARCRVDVTAEPAINGVQLSATALTTELYKTDYTSFEILLKLPHNYYDAAAATTYNLRSRGRSGNGITMTKAEFTNSAMKDLFELVILDDRSVQIVPDYDNAVMKPAAVSGSYETTILVTIGSGEHAQTVESEKLILSVKKTKPKLTGTVAAFNSFISEQSNEIIIKGATPVENGFSENEAKNTAKASAIPSWLDLGENGTLTLKKDAPLKNTSGNAYIKVMTEEWSIPAEVSVSVKNTFKAPGLKLSATSATMSLLTDKSAGAALKLQCTNKKDTLIGLCVDEVVANGGFEVVGFDVRDGSFVLKAPDGFKASSKGTPVVLTVSFENTKVTRDLKLTVETKEVSLKLASTSIALNRQVSDSIKVKVTATPADYQIKDIKELNLTLTATQTVNGKKVTVNKLDSGELGFDYENGDLVIRTTSLTPEKATYKLSVSSGDSKPVTATINVSSAKATVTYKATGSMDLSFPTQTATIKPTFKNYKGEIKGYKYAVQELKGSTVMGDVTGSFAVTFDGTAFQIRCLNDNVDTTRTYKVSLILTLNDGSTVDNVVSLKVKRTSVKLKLGATKLTLNKQIGDEVSTTVSSATKGYDVTKPIVHEVKDKNKLDASNQLSIRCENGRIYVAANGDTVYGMTYTIALKANEKATAQNLTVTVLKEEASKVTVSLKASGKIDVIRAGSAVTITPTYMNRSTAKPTVEELYIYSSEDKYKDPVNERFVITPDGNGSFRITNRYSEEHPLKHGVTYKVKLVSKFGEVEATPSALTTMSVTMGSAKLTTRTSNTTLFANDKNDRALVWFEASDATLNGVKSVSIATTTQAKQFEIIPYGDGVFAIGFKDGKVDAALTKKNTNSVTVKLNVYMDGNLNNKVNTTASVKLTIVK